MTILNGTNTVLQVNSSGAAPPADTTPPVLQTVATSVDGLTVTLTYNEALDTGSTPATGDFSFSPSKTISNVNVTGSTVVLTVTVAFTDSDTITLNYTAASNPIQDSAGNDAANLSGQSVTNNVPAAGGHSTTAQAVINRMSNLSTAEENAIAAFVDSQASAEGGSGNWELIDEFYCFALNSTDSLVGWKANTATNSGATYTANQGYDFDGSTDYIDTNVDLTSQTNFSLDDALIGAFVYSNVANGATVVTGSRESTTNKVTIRDDSANTRIQVWVNQSNGGFSAYNTAAVTGKTLYVATREDSAGALSELNVNGSGTTIAAQTSTGISQYTPYIGAENYAGVTTQPWEGVVTCWVVGAAIGFDHSDFDTELNTLLTTLGVSTT